MLQHYDLGGSDKSDPKESVNFKFKTLCPLMAGITQYNRRKAYIHNLALIVLKAGKSKIQLQQI